jgi:hypothetical protein
VDPGTSYAAQIEEVIDTFADAANRTRHLDCARDPLRLARSDDGGETIAEMWLVEQDNVDGLLFGTCSSSLASDPRSGLVYWGHPSAWPPGNRSRANYTISSTLDGKRWSLVDVVYPGGAGYSDVMALPNGNLGVAFQRTLFESAPGVSNICGPCWLCNTVLVTKYRGWKRLGRWRRGWRLQHSFREPQAEIVRPGRRRRAEHD